LASASSASPHPATLRALALTRTSVPPPRERVNRARAGARRHAGVCDARAVKLAGAALIALAAVGGILALAAGDSTALTAIAIALIGLAAVGAVSMMFWAIGRAEDRDREEAAARREGRDPGPESGNGKPPEEPHPRTLGLGPDRRRPRPPRRPQ